MKQIFLLIIFIVLHLSSLRAQPVIHVEAGANMLIQPQATLNFGGLMIIPSGALLLDNISLERTAVVQYPLLNSYIQRVYRFSNPVQAFSGIIRFYYEENELNQLPETLLTLNIYNGVEWQSFTTNIIHDVQNNFLEANITTSINLYELTLSAQTALPLKWGEIKGNCSSNNITIQWETFQELNTGYFIVERSNNGTVWQMVQKKTAVGQSGSPSIYSYSMEDTSMTSGLVWYYRIKSVDLDGSYYYSKIIAIKPCSFSNSIKLFPIPASTTLQLSFTSGSKQKGSMSIYNAQGQWLKMQSLSIHKGDNLFVVDVHSLLPGVYYVKLILSDREPLPARFVKQ